jgi:hypothetical protein
MDLQKTIDFLRGEIGRLERVVASLEKLRDGVTGPPLQKTTGWEKTNEYRRAPGGFRKDEEVLAGRRATCSTSKHGAACRAWSSLSGSSANTLGKT